MPNKIQGAVERLTTWASQAERLNPEDAIIATYGLPEGGRRERHAHFRADITALLALHQQQAASTCEGEWVAIPRKALEPFRLACERYFHTQCHFEITGSTSAERGFSEGERDDTAIELAVSDLRGEHFVELGLALSAAPSSGIGGEAEALVWLATQPSLSLGYAYGDPDDDAGSWEVHAERGGVNDREWHLIATGATPLEAVQVARSILTKDPDHG